MRFIFEQIRTGGDRNFAYLIGDRLTHEAIIVDPSFDPDLVIDRAEAQGLEVKLILNTHGHADHTNGNALAKERTKAPVAAYEGSSIEFDIGLRDAQLLEIGSLQLVVLYTPGHCDDHLVLYIADMKIALTGDLILVGKVGGTSDAEQARTEFESLLRVQRDLPDDTTIWPGHDYGCRPCSTMALEKATNPFLMASSFIEFSNLKKSWPLFKKNMGLQ